MELTITEQLLINGLKLFGVEGENIVGILLRLSTEEEQNQLIDFMLENKTATEQEILRETSRIRGK